MGKILYPVGTKVLLKKDDYDDDPLYVVKYRKGKPFPYGLSTYPDGSPEEFDGHKWFSVKGIKFYNKPEKKQDGAAPSVESSENKKSSSCNCGDAPQQKDTYSVEEVNEIVDRVLDHVDMVFNDLNSAVLRTMDTTDRNMLNIADKFAKIDKHLNHLPQTLSHNDD